jgi:hypothetical protein
MTRVWPYTLSIGIVTGGAAATLSIIKWRRVNKKHPLFGSLLGLPSF